MIDATEIQDQVRRAAASSEALCIVGGNSKKNIGRMPVGNSIDVSPLAGVVEYQPTELMITARAGTTISDLRAILAQENLMLASESPEYNGKATIGGTLACNQSGPARPWSGSIRDHVLGIRLINGNAEHLRFGGQVMKNVAGYDVSRLQAGAMGAFGILTEVSLKVLPKPEASITLRRDIDADEAIRVMNDIGMTPVPVTGACWYDGAMFLRLSGPADVIDSVASGLEGEMLDAGAAIWTRLREQTLPFFSTDKDLWRFSVRPNSSLCESQGDWFIDWGGARRWLAGQHDRDDLETIARKCGGEVFQVRGADRKADLLPSLPAAKRALLMRMKQAFDPAGVFNPGRLYSWM